MGGIDNACCTYNTAGLVKQVPPHFDLCRCVSAFPLVSSLVCMPAHQLSNNGERHQSRNQDQSRKSMRRPNLSREAGPLTERGAHDACVVGTNMVTSCRYVVGIDV